MPLSAWIAAIAGVLPILVAVCYAIRRAGLRPPAPGAPTPSVRQSLPQKKKYLRTLFAIVLGVTATIAIVVSLIPKNFIQSLSWQKKTAVNRPPEGAYEEASGGAETLDWKEAQVKGTIEAFKGYLMAHPGGVHAPQATALLSALCEDRDWTAATKDAKPAAYLAFHRTYPDSQRLTAVTADVECSQNLTVSMGGYGLSGTMSLSSLNVNVDGHPKLSGNYGAQESGTLSLGDRYMELGGTVGKLDRAHLLVAKTDGKPRIVAVDTVPGLAELLRDNKDPASYIDALVKDKAASVRHAATWALGKIGPAAVPRLAEFLKDKDTDVCSAAAAALGEIGPAAKDAVAVLVEVAKNKDTRVRRAVAETLGKIGPAANDAVPVLSKLAKDEDAEVRAAAAQALGRVKSTPENDLASRGQEKATKKEKLPAPSEAREDLPASKPVCGSRPNSQEAVDRLVAAAESGDAATVKTELDRGADIDGRGVQSSATALMLACQNGRSQIVRMLLDRGANASLSQDGSTPLMSAALWGYSDIVGMLLDKGTSIDAKGANGKTALYYASLAGNDDTAALLVERGADTNQKTAVSTDHFVRGSVTDVDVKNKKVKVLVSHALKFAEKGAEVPFDASEARYFGIKGIDDLRKSDAVLVHYTLVLTVGSVNFGSFSGSADTSYKIQQLAVHR